MPPTELVFSAIRFLDLDAAACGLFAQGLDLVVILLAEDRARRTADPCADDAPGVTANRPAKEVAERAAQTRADRSARDLLLASVGIGDAGRGAKQRQRGGARQQDTRKSHDAYLPLVRGEQCHAASLATRNSTLCTGVLPCPSLTMLEQEHACRWHCGTFVLATQA
jgi:hypothetical protein